MNCTWPVLAETHTGGCEWRLAGLCHQPCSAFQGVHAADRSIHNNKCQMGQHISGHAPSPGLPGKRPNQSNNCANIIGLEPLNPLRLLLLDHYTLKPTVMVTDENVPSAKAFLSQTSTKLSTHSGPLNCRQLLCFWLGCFIETCNSSLSGM
jgi:hypothetical protein